MLSKTFQQEGFVMTKFRIGGASILGALLLSTAAYAEVTAEQVWANWQTLTASYGQTLTAASESRTGDTLVITDMNVSSTFEGGAVNGTIETVNFRELGDGTVEITMSPDYPLVIDTTDPDGKKTRVNVMIRQPDLKMIAGGTDAETRYDFTVPSLKVSVDEVTVDEKPFDLALDVDVTAMGGNYVVTKGQKTRLASTLNADSMGIVMAVTDPDTGGKVNLKGNLTMLAGTSNGTLLDVVAMADMAAALKAGFATDGNFTYGASTLEFDVVEADLTTKGSATLGSGDILFAMNADRLNYGGGAKDVAITVSGGGIPFPELKTSYAEAEFNLLMPVTKSDIPGDFALLTRLVDFTISDEVWSLFDPSAILPRDPATVVIDTKGKANWLVDIMDPAATEAMGPDAAPGQIHALDITELTVRALGAAVTGAGSFTFDNADLTTFDGMPAPTGKLDVKIVGASGLLDKLIQLGYVPEDQAMGARMMMGLFAKPGEGEDTLTSTLEFKDKGFFANGQRLQ